MKTTLDLPDNLVHQAKLRALQQGCTLKDLIAEFIRLGLHGGPSTENPCGSEVVTLDAKGFPVFRPLATGSLPTLDLATALLLEQECLMQEDRRRAGVSA